jgi:hypothetical protein
MPRSLIEAIRLVLEVGIGVWYGPLFIRLKISNLKNVNLASQEARSCAGRSDVKQDG